MDELSVVADLHGHSTHSDKTQERYLGIPGDNHVARDPRYVVQAAERAPDWTDIVFSVTDHYETAGSDHWAELQAAFEDHPEGTARRGDYVFSGAIGRTAAWGINGVEAAFSDDLSHEYLLYGLPLDDQREHIYEDIDAALEASEDAALGVDPHPFMPGFDWGEERRAAFFAAADAYDVAVGVEQPLGYGLFNRFADGRWGADRTVNDIVEEYDVPAVPGHDVHAHHAGNAALVDASAVDALQEDRVPVDELTDAAVVHRDGLEGLYTAVRDTVGAGLTFHGMALQNPVTDRKSFYRELAGHSVPSYRGLTRDDVAEDAVRLNGEDGLVRQLAGDGQEHR